MQNFERVKPIDISYEVAYEMKHSEQLFNESRLSEKELESQLSTGSSSRDLRFALEYDYERLLKKMDFYRRKKRTKLFSIAQTPGI